MFRPSSVCWLMMPWMAGLVMVSGCSAGKRAGHSEEEARVSASAAAVSCAKAINNALVDKVPGENATGTPQEVSVVYWTADEVREYHKCLNQNSVFTASSTGSEEWSRLKIEGPDHPPDLASKHEFGVDTVWVDGDPIGSRHMVYFRFTKPRGPQLLGTMDLIYRVDAISDDGAASVTANEIIDSWSTSLFDAYEDRLYSGAASASLSIDAKGKPHVAYYKNVGTEQNDDAFFQEFLGYRVREEEAWVDVVDAASALSTSRGRYVQIATGTTDQSIHIVARRPASSTEKEAMDYIHFAGGSWSHEAVRVDPTNDTDSRHLAGLSIGLTSADQPIVSYVYSSPAGSGVGLMSRDQQIWNYDHIDNQGVVGNTSLAVGSDDKARVCYTTSEVNIHGFFVDPSGAALEPAAAPDDATPYFVPELRCSIISGKGERIKRAVSVSDIVQVEADLTLDGDDNIHVASRGDAPLYSLMDGTGVSGAGHFVVPLGSSSLAFSPAITFGARRVHVAYHTDDVIGGEMYDASLPKRLVPTEGDGPVIPGPCPNPPCARKVYLPFIVR